MEKELAIKEKKLEELQSQYRRLKTDYDDYVVCFNNRIHFLN